MLNLKRTFIGGLCIMLTFAMSAASADELISNGGFETGDFTDWLLFPTGSGHQIVTNINPASGTWAAEILNGTEASSSGIQQANLAAGFLTPNQEVTVSFDARGLLGIGGVAFAVLHSEVDGGGVSKTDILGGGPLGLDGDSSVWTNFSFTTTLGGDVSGGVSLRLDATNGAVSGQSSTVWYDNVSIDAVRTVPEPGSFALLGLGGLGMVLRRRRKCD